MRATRFMFVAAVAMIGLVSTTTVAALFAAASDTRERPPVEAPESSDATTADTTATRRSSSRDDQLEADLNMTRFMSQPSGRWAPMIGGQLPNSQLHRSQDPAYLRQLEQLQDDIDRMLANPG